MQQQVSGISDIISEGLAKASLFQPVHDICQKFNTDFFPV